MRVGLRIAQVSPLHESVPPKLYGGTERIVACLTEALVQLGHDVTLFASGDSKTSAKLVSPVSEALRAAGAREPLAPHLLMLEQLKKLEDEFDIVHFHTEYMHFPMARSLSVPSVSTLHWRLDLPEYRGLFSEFQELPLTSIADHQRGPLPHSNWVATVHHGIDPAGFGHRNQFNGEGGYLAFLGRFSPEKGFHHAVEIARRTGMRLKVAAKVEPKDAGYFDEIQPLLREPFVEYIGEIGDHEKAEFLGRATALLFPVTWPEPFGLVMIESLATGTPVVAFSNGAVPEVIRDGATGFICNSNDTSENVDQAVKAVGRIHEISRATCRKEFEERFTAERMAMEYVNIYRRVIKARAQITPVHMGHVGWPIPAQPQASWRTDLERNFTAD